MTIAAGAVPSVFAGRAARTTAAVMLAAGLFALCHPYPGLVGDATIYVGRAAADLDPAGVGRDLAFADDGQSRFSVFARVATPLVAALGPSKAALLLAAAANACVFAALLALASTLAEGRLAFAVLVAAAVMPRQYGDGGVFLVAETAAHARPFAEAAVIGAVAALLAGRRTLAAGLLGAALLVHPIMAMAGIGTAAILLVWRKDRRRTAFALAVVGLAGCGALLLGFLGTPPFERIVAPVDKAWLDILVTRSPFLFPHLWSDHAAGQVVAQGGSVLLAASFGPPTRRRIFVATVLSALLQLAGVTILGDGLHSLLAIQEQGWRALWLVAVLGACALPLLAADLWPLGARGRVALACVGLAWFVPLPPLVTLSLLGLAALLRSGRYARGLPERYATLALAIAAALCIACAPWAGYVAYLRTAPPALRIGTIPPLLNNLETVPVMLALAVWLLRPRRTFRAHGSAEAIGLAATGLAAIVVVAFAALSWDQRSPGAALLESRREPPGFASLSRGRPPEVLWLDGLGESWFFLGRPQYMSAQQPVGSVFSRALAMEWRRRARVLVDIGLVPPSILAPYDAAAAAGARQTATPDKLAAFCHRTDAPGIVIIPQRDGRVEPLVPGAIRWALPAPIWTPDDVDPALWHATDGFVALPCAPPRG